MNHTITFLGTGTSQGVPVISCQCDICRSSDEHDKRLRASILVEVDDRLRLVIDCGPDFRYQMLRENIQSIDAVLLTHQHRDHVGGIDDLRAFNYTLNRSMDIYAEARVQEALKREFDYAFAPNPYPGVPELTLHEIDTKPFYINDIEIIPIRGFHYRLPVLGFRIGEVGYITDMNRIDPEEIDKLKGVKVLAVNALRHEKHISHFTLSEALHVIEQVQPDRAYLTHISHQMGLHREVEITLPESVYLAYDGLKTTT